MVERKIGDKVIRLIRGDITDMEVEAFVYDIGPNCKLDSGYGNAITQRGGKVIQDQLDLLGELPTGAATITTAGELKAKHIIHTNGPKYCEPDTEAKLRLATLSALELADKRGIAQLALPPIGSGLYQVPLDLCAKVMVQTVSEHLQRSQSLKEVDFVALDTREYKPLAASIQGGA